MEQNQVPVKNEAERYSVPWKPIDNWIGIALFGLIDLGLLYVAYKGQGTQLAQSVVLIVVQLTYLLPIVVVFTYRHVSPRALGFGPFHWGALGLGCGLLILSYMVILIHNGVLTLLGVSTQGDEIMQLVGALDSPIWLFIVGVILAPIVEEIFFRGFLFQGFRHQYGWVAGMLISSAIFGAAHLDPVAFIPTFILGCLLAYMYHLTHSVWPGVILHVTVNAMGLLAAYAVTHLPELIPV